MDDLDLDITRSLRGSATRDAILLAAERRDRAYLQQFARDVGVSTAEARGAIIGGLPRFAPELALVQLELLRPTNTDATEFEITPRGRAAASIRRARGDRRKL